MTESVWILVTSGRGPVECQIAVQKIALKVYDEAVVLKFAPFIPTHTDAEHGWHSALVSLDNPTEEFLKSWEGTIQWICQSPIRTGHKRKNWFVSSNVVRYTPVEFSFEDSDLKFDTYRASGPGGQHVNKTDSAVRVTHIPTGMVADAQEERSQYRNKALAIARLSDILKQKVDDSKKALGKETWKKHDELERGNAIRTYRGLDFK